jgi:nucleoside-diphosphate-sugar epimerase
MSKKTIIITGGAGKIGKKLIQDIATNVKTQNKIKVEIIVLDNFVSSSIEEFDDIKNKLSDESVQITLYDFNIKHPNLINFIKERYYNVDCIYHFAFNQNDNPVEVLEVGYTGSKNILELAKYYKSKMFYKKRKNNKIIEDICRAYTLQYGIETCPI